MVTVTICCQHCGSGDLVRNGYTLNGKQRYRCKSCKRQSRENPAPNGYTEERREEIIKAYTAHVERWNCTLRQRLGRFVRETISFSKSIRMHIICLDLFLHRYNLDKAILLD